MLKIQLNNDEIDNETKKKQKTKVVFNLTMKKSSKINELLQFNQKKNKIILLTHKHEHSL